MSADMTPVGPFRIPAWAVDAPPLKVRLPTPGFKASGHVRYLRGDELEAIERQARWTEQWREVRARWARVYDPVHTRAQGRLRWEIESHAPVFGYSDVGPPPNRPHCGRCWPDSYTGAERDWPCEPFRELRAQVARGSE